MFLVHLSAFVPTHKRALDFGGGGGVSDGWQTGEVAFFFYADRVSKLFIIPGKTKPDCEIINSNSAVEGGRYKSDKHGSHGTDTSSC